MGQNPQQELQENIRELISGLDDARGLIEKKTQVNISNLLVGLSAPDIADLMDDLDPGEASFVFRLLDDATASQVVTKINDHIQEELLKEIDERRLAKLVGEMESDDAADLMARLPEETAKRILAATDADLSHKIRELLKHEEDTAGGLMATELVTADQNATVKETIEMVRKAAGKIENLYYVYIMSMWCIIRRSWWALFPFET